MGNCFFRIGTVAGSSSGSCPDSNHDDQIIYPLNRSRFSAGGCFEGPTVASGQSEGRRSSANRRCSTGCASELRRFVQCPQRRNHRGRQFSGSHQRQGSCIGSRPDPISKYLPFSILLYRPFGSGRGSEALGATASLRVQRIPSFPSLRVVEGLLHPPPGSCSDDDWNPHRPSKSVCCTYRTSK